MKDDVTTVAKADIPQGRPSGEPDRGISGRSRTLFDYCQHNLSLNAQRGLLLLFIFCQVLFFAGYLALQRDRIEDDATRILRNTALLEADQFETNLDAMRYQMRVIGNAILLNHTIAPKNAAPFLMHEMKREWLDGVIVFDAKGDFIVKNSRTPFEQSLDAVTLAQASFRDSGLFHELRNADVKERLFYWRGNGTDPESAGFVIYRAVSYARGGYLGGVVGYFRATTMRKLFMKMQTQGFDLGPGGVMAVVERDTGRQLVRMGAGATTHASKLASVASMSQATDLAVIRHYVSVVDGVPRLGVFLNINDRKWVLIVSLAERDILRGWYAQTIMIVLGLLIMAILQWLLLHYARANYLQRERFANEARQDPLTELANRRYFDEWAQSACSLALRHQQPLCVLALDLDFFKNINDKYGHDGGDAVLRHVAKVLRGSLRVSDIAARFGGEEFVVAMPHTGLDKAEEVAERIRALLTVQEVGFKGQTIRVTASFGVAQMTVAELEMSDGIHATLARADQALYCSKLGGRNRVTLANEA